MLDTRKDCSFFAYIDEAGEHGSKFATGSSHFIVMGAVILPAWRPNLADELFAHARELTGRRKPFHKFANTGEKDNFVLTRLFGLYGLQVVQVAFYKPSLGDNWIRMNFQREYNYLIKFTLERVSWAVRNRASAMDPSTGKCHVVFSESAMLSYASIDAYLRKLKFGRERFNCSVNWECLTDDFAVEKHTNESETHLADIAASALHKAIEPKRHGLTDDRFERNLFPCLLRSRRTPVGLKLFPGDAIQRLQDAGELEFLRLL